MHYSCCRRPSHEDTSWDPVASHAVTRRDFLHTSMAGAAAVAIGGADGLFAQADRDAVVAEIARQHDATVQLLREWIALPSIAAENLNYPKGADDMARLARDAGFGRVNLIPTAGKPGVFATLDGWRGDDAGALLHVRRQAVQQRRSGARRRSRVASWTDPEWGRS